MATTVSKNILASTQAQLKARMRAEILHFFDGFDLIGPGLVRRPPKWTAADSAPGVDAFEHPIGIAGVAANADGT